MPDQLQTFRSFFDITLANDLAEKLKKHNINIQIEKSNINYLDAALVNTATEPSIHILLKPDDFAKADKIMEEHYKETLDTVDKDYYLFEFTNLELIEIISKPDEWGHFDYQLAQKILNERGLVIEEKTIQKLKIERIRKLSEPEKASRVLVFFGYCFIPFGLIPSFFIGRHLFYSKRSLPNGQVLFSYKDSDRKHGDRIMIITGFLIIISIITLAIIKISGH